MKDASGDFSNQFCLFNGCAFGRHRGRRADTQHVRAVEGFAAAANQHRNVGSLTSAVRVQFVKHEELQPLRLINELSFLDTCEDQLQHHIVGQQDVRRILSDPISRLLVLLPRIAVIADQGFVISETTFQKFVELFLLAVGQCIHGIHDDGLKPAPCAMIQDMVHDRDDVGEAFAGTRTGGQHVRPVLGGNLNRLVLVQMQTHRTAEVVLVSLGSKDPCTVGMQHILLNELINRSARFKRRIQLQERFGPKEPLLHLLFNAFTHSLIRNADEAFRVVGVIRNHVSMKFKCVHQLCAESLTGFRSRLGRSSSRCYYRALFFSFKGSAALRRNSSRSDLRKSR